MKLLTRAEWGATYDVAQRPPMKLPVARAFIHHTVTAPTTDPAADMRAVERIDIGRFGYPSYSWVIHPTGVVLEGMGTHIGAHTIHNNSTSFGISFIGNFENDQPTKPALDACATLLAARIAQSHLTAGFTLDGHRDVFATACPGAHLYPLLAQIRSTVTTPTEDFMAALTDDEQRALFARVAAIQTEVNEIKARSLTPEQLDALVGPKDGLYAALNDRTAKLDAKLDSILKALKV